MLHKDRIKLTVYMKQSYSNFALNNKHREPLNVYLYIIILVAIFVIFNRQNFWI